MISGAEQEHLLSKRRTPKKYNLLSLPFPRFFFFFFFGHEIGTLHKSSSIIISINNVVLFSACCFGGESEIEIHYMSEKLTCSGRLKYLSKPEILEKPYETSSLSSFGH